MKGRGTHFANDFIAFGTLLPAFEYSLVLVVL